MLDRNKKPESKSAGPGQLNSRLEKKLAAYMAAAGAAGVSILAAQPAEATVVFTPANSQIETNNFPIDVNNDGVPDFSIKFFGAYHQVNMAVDPLVAGNAVRGTTEALAGHFGVPIGPAGAFTTAKSYFGQGVYMAGFFQYSVSSFKGPWANAENRYLGFKFLIHGQTHYGWARLSVTNDMRDILLTGYAYETVPNKAILAGHTTGPEEIASIGSEEMLSVPMQPASLGVLARGADSVSIWRRENEDGVQNL